MVIPALAPEFKARGLKWDVSLYSDRLKALAEIMDEAAKVALVAREKQEMELKPDGSIVTNADRDVEIFLRRELLGFLPGSSFWGEEFGRDEPGEAGCWLIDPVDGTSNFAFGSPLWGISVGLTVNDKLELGAIWLPDLQEFYLAEAGGGAWLNGKAINAIPPGRVLPHELVSYSDRLLRRYRGQAIPGKMRCSGAFVIDGAFTAMQRYRGLIGQGESLYDAAASILINLELGAEVRWANGGEFDYAQLIRGRPFDHAWIIFPGGTDFRLDDPG